MSTRILTVFALIALVVFGAVYMVILNSPDVAPAAPPAADVKQPPQEGKPRTLLAGWAKPAATLILTGEMHGYLEPCGCTEGQHGGLARRGDLIRQIKAKGWPLAGFDVGGLMNHPSRKQTEFKFDSALRSLERLDYAAIGVGVEEVRMDAAKLVQIDLATTPFVSANVIFTLGVNPNPTIQDALSEDPASVYGRRPWKLVKIGDVKVAVTSIFGVRYQAEVLGAAGKTADIVPVDPVAALKLLIPTMQAAKPDLMLLLSNAYVEESEDLAKKFPQFQIVLTAGGPEEPGLAPKFVGKTMIVMAGAKGRNVGVVGFYPKAEPKLKFELVDLDGDRFQHLPAIDDDMKAYQEAIAQAKLAESQTAVPHPGKGNVDGADLRFVGAAKCGECHTKAFSRLANSKHMHAHDSLIKGRKDEKNPIARNNDPECLACHVTGWDPKEVTPYLSGYLFEEMVKDKKGKPYKPDLKGNQCENCHGPGSKHVEAELVWKKTNKLTTETRNWRSFMHNDVATAEAQICRKCHDGDNSPKFEFKKYWEQIQHPGRD